MLRPTPNESVRRRPTATTSACSVGSAGQPVPERHPDVLSNLSVVLDAAQQGHAWAQFELGAAYFYGHRNPRNLEEAFQWAHRAADQGVAEAQFDLGVAYANGQGVPPNEVAALTWFRRPANQVLPDAQFNLGEMYAQGRGVPRDDAIAAHWYARAVGHAARPTVRGTRAGQPEGWPRAHEQAQCMLRAVAADHGTLPDRTGHDAEEPATHAPITAGAAAGAGRRHPSRLWSRS